MSSLLNSIGVRTGALCFAFALSASLLACTDDGGDEMGDGDTMSDTGDGDPGDGDPGDGDPGDGDGDAGDLTYAGDIEPLFTASCGCHTAGGPAATTLTLSHAAIVGVASMQATSLNIVTAGDASSSYLVNKLRDTQADVMGLGTMMPPPAALAEDQIVMVEDWINAGALP